MRESFLLILCVTVILYGSCELLTCNPPHTPAGLATYITPPPLKKGSDGSDARQKHRGSKPNSPEKKEGHTLWYTNDAERLVVLNLRDDPVWKSVAELNKLLEKGESFLDITDSVDVQERSGRVVDKSSAKISNVSSKYPFPDTIRFKDIVFPMLMSININRQMQFLTHLSTAFKFRTGARDKYDESAKAVQWIGEELAKIVANYKGSSCINITKFLHLNFPTSIQIKMNMKTIIVRILGSEPTLMNEIVVLSAHIDAIANDWGSTPGADDNASGATALIESLRILVESNFVPKRTLELHWYAYEELGLFGSNQVSAVYKNQSLNVVGLLNLDIVGYVPKDQDPEARKIAISQEMTNPDLTTFVTKLAEEYVAIPWLIKEVCAGCKSDHFPWSYRGYPTAFPHEMVITPFIHSTKDTVETVDYIYLREFTKLALAYAVEYAEPTI